MNKYIPIAPLPQIKQLLRGLISHQSTGSAWCAPSQKAIFVPRASQGLGEIIKILLKSKKKGILFLPDYFCDEALIPLRRLLIKLVFYPITENLNPNWEMLNKMVEQCGKPDIFILVHYFGFPNDIKEALTFCNRTNAVLIEDAAHVFLPFDDIGKYSAAAIYSLYKNLPLPMLGLVVANKEFDFMTYQKSFDGGSFIWLVKRLIQLFIVKSHLSIRRKTEINSGKNILSPFITRLSVSKMALKLLSAAEKEFEQVRTIRRKNYKMIELEIRMQDNIMEPLFRNLPENVCPYLFPLKIKQNIKEIYYQLNRNGIPAQTWPTLPAEVLAAPDKHKTALQLYNGLLTIPVNQSISEKQLSYIIQKLRFSIK